MQFEPHWAQAYDREVFSNLRELLGEKGVLLSGGAALSTGGRAILASAAWSRLSRNKDPCKALATEGLKNLEGRLPTLTVVPPLQPASAGTATPERTSQF